MNEPTNHPNKSTLRNVFLEKRKTLTASEFQKKNAQILYQLVKTLSEIEFKTIHIFLPIRKQREVNTWPVIELIKGYGKKVVISKSDVASNQLTHFEFESTDQLAVNKWGIPEPKHGKSVNVKEIDLVLVPLIVFDKNGHRIGYGKGYYDQFLSECRPDCLKVGLSLSHALDRIEFTEQHDFTMNLCVSPLKIYEFKN